MDNGQKNDRQLRPQSKANSNLLIYTIVILAMTFVIGNVVKRRVEPVDQGKRSTFESAKTASNRDLSTEAVVAEIRAVLPTLMTGHDPRITTAATSVSAKLNEYEAFVREQLVLARGLNIDYIGMYHAAEDQLNNPDILASQAKVFNLLQQHQWPIIAWEGSGCQRVSWGCLENEAVDWVRRENLPYSREIIAAAVSTSIKTDGALQHLVKQPDVFLVGAEEIPLFDLCTLLVDNAAKQPDSFEAIAVWPIARFRSQMALARIVKQMRQNSIPRGVVIMGIGHESDFLSMFRTHGINGETFDTT